MIILHTSLQSSLVAIRILKFMAATKTRTTAMIYSGLTTSGTTQDCKLRHTAHPGHAGSGPFLWEDDRMTGPMSGGQY